MTGAEAVEAIRARMQASLDRDLWHPALDDIRRLLAALDESRAEVVDRDALIDYWSTAASNSLYDAKAAEARATAAEAVVASVRSTVGALLRTVTENRYQYERVHVEADLNYLTALLPKDES